MKSAGAAVAVMLLVLAVALPVAAQSDIDQPPNFGLEPRENDVAVVIGIDKYLNVEAPSAYSVDDAKLVKEYLKSLGFRDSNIQLITNERATLSAFSAKIEGWLPRNVKPDGKVFFYYSGHGSPDLSDAEKPRAFMLPYDGDPSELATTGYSVETLYDRLGKLKAKEVIVVMDSCYSGQGGRSVLAQGARPLVSNIVPVGTIAGNMAVLTATQPNQISTSSPEKKHGILTYHFLKAIREGKGSLQEIYKKIKPAVEDDAHSLGVKQSPALLLGPSKAERPFSLATDLEIAIAKQKKEEQEKQERLRREEEERKLAEQKRLDEEKKRIEEEKVRIEAAQREADRKHREDLERIERETREREQRLRYEAEQREADQRRRFEEEKRRLQKSRTYEEPAYVPPTF